MPLSPGRLARLKRYDVDWDAALAKIDVAKLTPLAKSDLESLRATVAANQVRLDDDAATLARVTPLVPFAPRIVQLVEARIRIEDVIPERVAGILTQIAREIGVMRARLEAGLSGAGDNALRVRKDEAVLGADAADNLRAMVAEWFGFYNGYDPMFTWWMGVPFKQVDTALQGYASVLREKVAAADQPVPEAPVRTAPVAPAPAPRFNSVSRPPGPHHAAAGRDDACGAAFSCGHRRARWTRRPACRRNRVSRAGVLPPMARGAEDARLRHAHPQRAGGLPLHQADGRGARSPARP